MNIILMERKCKLCGLKLTEYETKEKACHCMDCYKEAFNMEETEEVKFDSNRIRNKHYRLNV